MLFKKITSMEDLSDLVLDAGFVPFFKNHIPGFSIEECTPGELWFSDTLDGPWEWKGPVIRETGCAYGKIFGKKAAFVRKDLYTELANHRRDGYDADARYDDGLMKARDIEVYRLIEAHGPALSKSLKKMYPGDFDASVTRLQMMGYAVISDFEYARDSKGQKYGWGIAKYATPEQYFGSDFKSLVYNNTPQKSRLIIYNKLKALLPDASDKDIYRIIG